MTIHIRSKPFSYKFYLLDFISRISVCWNVTQFIVLNTLVRRTLPYYQAQLPIIMAASGATNNGKKFRNDKTYRKISLTSKPLSNENFLEMRRSLRLLKITIHVILDVPSQRLATDVRLGYAKIWPKIRGALTTLRKIFKVAQFYEYDRGYTNLH